MAPSRSSRSAKERSSRRLRETLWKEVAEWEDSICKPYMEIHNASPEKWHQIIKERSDVIMKTNADLQLKLAQQTRLVQGLQQEFEVKGKAWESVQKSLRDGKHQQKEACEQLNELREARLGEERQLREKTVALRRRLMGLTKNQRQLDQTRREDEQRLSRNQDVLEELRLMQDDLELRKSEFDLADELEPVELVESVSTRPSLLQRADSRLLAQRASVCSTSTFVDTEVQRHSVQSLGRLSEDGESEGSHAIVVASPRSHSLRKSRTDSFARFEPAAPETPRQGKSRPSARRSCSSVQFPNG
jgi:hypothetical protein